MSNISISSLVGSSNVSSDISVNELAKSIHNENKYQHKIDEIIELQEKNKKQKNIKYEQMYKDVINLIYDQVQLHHTNMIYTIPYNTELNDYNYEEFKNYLIQKLTKNNIAITQYNKYNITASENQYIITWRFIGCKK